MFVIRNGIFETNSSSCHVFMFPRNMDIKIPSVVILDDDYTSDNMLNIYFNDINWGEEYTTPFIQFLYKCGVKEIKYTGKYKYVTEAIKKYKDIEEYDGRLRINEENLKKICFGTDVKTTVLEDYEVCDKAIANYGDFEDYCSIRLS